MMNIATAHIETLAQLTLVFMLFMVVAIVVAAIAWGKMLDMRNELAFRQELIDELRDQVNHDDNK